MGCKRISSGKCRGRVQYHGCVSEKREGSIVDLREPCEAIEFKDSWLAVCTELKTYAKTVDCNVRESNSVHLGQGSGGAAILYSDVDFSRDGHRLNIRVARHCIDFHEFAKNSAEVGILEEGGPWGLKVRMDNRNQMLLDFSCARLWRRWDRNTASWIEVNPVSAILELAPWLNSSSTKSALAKPAATG